MNRYARYALALLLALYASLALAAPAAVVEGVQMPAWVERSGMKIPAAPGMELKPRDELRTGVGARLYVKLADGSLLKLGENASLRLLDIAPPKGGFLKGAVEVLEGAFRFTSDKFVRHTKRDINFKIATVTLGIRGTDFWGRSRIDNEIVCLIEGKVELGSGTEQPVTMDKPLQFYKRDAGRTQPVAFVDPAQLKLWAAETDIAAGTGVARRDGRISLTLEESEDQAVALKRYDALRDSGYPAEIRPVHRDGKLVYRVQIRNLGSQAEADVLAKRLKP